MFNENSVYSQIVFCSLLVYISNYNYSMHHLCTNQVCPDTQKLQLIESLLTWCNSNPLKLSMSKIKELMVD